MGKYRKDIVPVGLAVNTEGGEVVFNKEYIEMLVKNTRESGHNTYVPLRHTADPAQNTGYVDNFGILDGSLYGDFDIIDKKSSDYIEQGLIKKVSIGVADPHSDKAYIDHVALTLKPYVNNQEPFIRMEGDIEVIYLENNELTEWGGDTMSEEKANVFDKISSIFEKTNSELSLENKTLKSSKLELESEVTTLKLELKTAKSKVVELESADKVRTEKLKLEAKEADTKLQLEMIDNAIKQGKLTPAKKASILEAGFTTVQLEAMLGALDVVVNMENTTVATNPNDKPLELEAGEKERFERLGIEQTEENIKFNREQLEGGDK